MDGATVPWTTVRLDEVCKVVNGGTPKSKVAEYWGGDVQWLTPKDMGQMTGREIGTTPRTISDKGLQNSSARLVPERSVILSTRAPIGHLAINTSPMAFNQGCRGLVPGEGLDHLFLYYFLYANRALLEGLGSGTTFKELSSTNLKSVRIPLPPLEEQQRIVAILDEACEGLSRARAHAEANFQNARELFGNFASGLFDEITTATSTITSQVKELALAEKGSIRTGPFGSQLRHSEFVDQGIAVLGIDNAVNNEFRWGKRRFITEDKYDALRRYTVRPGDVIITIMGTCGRCAVIPDDIPVAINTKHLCCITLDQGTCLPKYLHAYFLHSPKARSYLAAEASGSVMDGLNMGIIKKLPVDLPSLDRQLEVVGRLNDLKRKANALATSAEAKISDLNDLRQSLLQKAFSGELT
ncbi:MAG: restriction endonuclease subunit S [Paracoccaceae bacterium]